MSKTPRSPTTDDSCLTCETRGAVCPRHHMTILRKNLICMDWFAGVRA
jgi:hypothetical protein